MIGAYRDDAGFVGEPDAPEDMTAAADEAQSRLMASAETLCAMCDRYAGDSGDDPDLIDALGAEIDALTARIRAALGEPRVLLHGGLVPMGMVR